MTQDTSSSREAHSTGSLSRQVAPGRDRAASEVVRTALRAMEGQELQLEVRRGALVAGEASGEAAPFDFDAFIADKRS